MERARSRRLRKERASCGSTHGQANGQANRGSTTPERVELQCKAGLGLDWSKGFKDSSEGFKDWSEGFKGSSQGFKDSSEGFKDACGGVDAIACCGGVYGNACCTGVYGNTCAATPPQSPPKPGLIALN